MAKNVKELNLVINDLQTKFEKQLSEFRESLKAATSPEPLAVNLSLGDITKKFQEFESKTKESIADLKKSFESICQRIETVESAVDRNEQYENNRKLLIHGIKESENERLVDEIAELFENKLEVTVDKRFISDCRRVGKKREGKTRPVVVCFSVKRMRDEIFINKAKLKGTEVVCTEFLTVKRLELFKKCRAKYGKQCWTSNGVVIVLSDGVRRVVSSMADANNLSVNAAALRA